MFFSQFTSYFVGIVSVGLLATASALPAPGAVSDEKKRQLGSVTGVVSSLQSQVNSILPQISALNPTSLTSASAVAPLVIELTSALETATESLTLLQSGGLLGLEKRSADAQDVATQLASVTTSIATTLGPFKNNKNFIIFGGLLSTVDAALQGVIFEASFLVDGLLVLVSGLLFSVVGTLQSLTFTLTLTLLGLL